MKTRPVSSTLNGERTDAYVRGTTVTFLSGWSCCRRGATVDADANRQAFEAKEPI